MKKRHFLLPVLVYALLALRVACQADGAYIHGYFLYTVEDQSVTITAYTGRETEVVVPAMIAGNPVNTIAAGSFSDSPTVTVIYLPDTVVTIEEGAFGVGQAVVYDGVDRENVDDKDIESDTLLETTQGQSALPPDGQAGPAPLGIPLANGGLVTTDDEGNLLLVDTQGVEYVLDDRQDYVREVTGGELTILSVDGDPVTVSEDGSAVSFDSGEYTVEFNTETGSKRVTDVEIGVVYEEIVDFGGMNEADETVVLEDEDGTEPAGASPLNSGDDENEDDTTREEDALLQQEQPEEEGKDSIVTAQTGHAYWKWIIPVVLAGGVIVVVLVRRIRKHHADV